MLPLWLRSFLYGRSTALRTMPYAAYLRTNHWQHKRLMALRRAGWRCQVCNEEASKGKPLDVHHRTYERRGAERAEDVIVLCRRCHELFHTTVGVVDK